MSSAKVPKGQPKDLLGILDTVELSPRDGETFDPFGDNNNVNIVVAEDQHDFVENTAPVQSKAKPLAKPNINTNNTKGNASKNKYAQVSTHDKEDEDDDDLQFTPITQAGTTDDFKGIMSDDVEKPPEKLKMTILTNYQLENDKRYAVKQEDDDVNWKEISNNPAQEDLPPVSTGSNMMKKKNKQAMKKEKPKKKEGPSILKNMMDEDVGEVGEWIEKTANVHANEDDDDDNQKHDDFDDVFDDNKPAVKQQPSSGTMKKGKADVIKENDENEEEDADEKDKAKEKRGEDLEKIRENALIKANLAASKVNAKKKDGFMMNNLKAKAQAISKSNDNESTAQSSFDNSQLNKKNIASDKEDISSSKEVSPANAPPNVKKSEKSKNPVLPKPVLDQVPKEEVKQQGNEAFNPENDDDWEAISKFNLEHMSPQNDGEEEAKIISFMDAWQRIKNLDLRDEMKQVHKDLNSNMSLLDKLIKPCASTKMPPALMSERDQIFAFAKVPFNNDDDMHFDMLRTIYIKFTDNYGVCPRFGSHWQQIGFQDRDPATDLRGVGMLGLLQILAFLNSHLELVKNIYEYSIDETHHFPLCIALLGVSKIMLEMLREGKLTGQINNQRSVINTINNMYFAIFYRIVIMYKGRKYTAGNYGQALSEVSTYARAEPAKILKEFLTFLDTGRTNI
jgi:hypothetical protein